MLNKNIENFIGCDCGYGEADIVLFGAPFDQTASFRPGARFAGKEIRANSFGIESYSPYQDKDLTEIKVFDAGELLLPIGQTEGALNQVEDFVTQIINDNKRPAMIGGEHLLTLSAVKALYKKYPLLHIIHFDAHTDLRDDYLGLKLSHATVMRRVWEIVGDERIYQFGIRSGEKSEFEWAAEHIYTRRFNFFAIENIVRKLAGTPIYLTLDIDVLDPSVIPGTGAPEAGGVSFNELLDALLKLKPLEIVGFDMVELAPIYDLSGASTVTACKLLREMLLL